jgi:hypothetical protein
LTTVTVPMGTLPPKVALKSSTCSCAHAMFRHTRPHGAAGHDVGGAFARLAQGMRHCTHIIYHAQHHLSSTAQTASRNGCQDREARQGGKTGRQDTETRSQQVRPAIHGAHSMYGVTCSCAVTCWHAMTYVHACMAHMYKHARMSRHTTA